MQMINGISEIIDQYDTFILDQWGVLHNGGDAFAAAVATLNLLQQRQKNVVILSNSGNTHHFSYQRLTDSGIDRGLYLDVITSGDHMRQNFQRGAFSALGTQALVFAWGDGENSQVLTDCGLQSCTVEDASLVLCYGIDRASVADYALDLAAAYARDLPLVVSNPDLVAMNPAGGLTLCPGSIAEAYVALGGKVYWHGKPQAQVYAMCDELVAGWGRAIAVGDSFDHDIRGANTAGIDSIFISSGIHAKELSSAANITDLANEYAVQPSYCLEWFQP